MNILPTIIIGILVVTYFIYVLFFSILLEPSLYKSIFYVFFFNVIFLMLIWTLLSTMYTPTADVPGVYHLNENQLELYNASVEEHKPFVLSQIYIEKIFELMTQTSHGFVRYCRICKIIKPDRAHHCSHCGICVLRMDHHCPWLRNCIGYSTHKYFMLTLFYLTVYCVFYLGTTVEYFMLFWPPRMNLLSHISLLFGFLCAAFFGLITAIFFVIHFNALLKNETTVESVTKINFVHRRYTFDLGKYENFKQIFGDDWKLWLFPIFTSKGDGCSFPIRVQSYSVTSSAQTSTATSRAPSIA